jgi:Flp pilus assembly protein TadB
MSDFNLDILCFPMRKKTEKIKKCKDSIAKSKNYKKFIIYLFVIMIILIIFFSILCYNHIINLIPVILAFACLCTAYFIDVECDKTIKKYEKLRQDLMDLLKSDICIHNHHCYCKEEYYSYMEGLDIDLIDK